LQEADRDAKRKGDVVTGLVSGGDVKPAYLEMVVATSNAGVMGEECIGQPHDDTTVGDDAVKVVLSTRGDTHEC
jgi:hypothetical protein